MFHGHSTYGLYTVGVAHILFHCNNVRKLQSICSECAQQSAEFTSSDVKLYVRGRYYSENHQVYQKHVKGEKDAKVTLNKVTTGKH
jgi:thymidine kinase